MIYTQNNIVPKKMIIDYFNPDIEEKEMDKLKQAKKVEAKGKFEPDTIYNATIVGIDDGQVAEFVRNTSKWRNPEQSAFLISLEIHKDGEVIGKDQEVHGYFVDDNGVHMVYTERSWFGRFKEKYGAMPDTGMQVKYLTDEKGFGRIKVD